MSKRGIAICVACRAVLIEDPTTSGVWACPRGCPDARWRHEWISHTAEWVVGDVLLMDEERDG
jgi:hypothetical protein